MPNGNQWIITTINFTTGWPVVWALKTIINKKIAQFLYKDIFMNYEAPYEFLSDNSSNLLADAI